MKIIYIAGPLKGKHAFEVHENIMEAERLGMIVTQAGAYPFIPHANTRHFFGVAEEDFFYKATLEMLRRCDAIALTKLWRASKGARAEEELARELQMEKQFGGSDFPIFDFSIAGANPYASLQAWVRAS